MGIAAAAKKRASPGSCAENDLTEDGNDRNNLRSKQRDKYKWNIVHYCVCAMQVMAGHLVLLVRKIEEVQNDSFFGCFYLLSDYFHCYVLATALAASRRLF